MPCKKGMRGCHAKCLHRAMVLEYHDARDAWEKNRETGDNMRMEDEEYKEAFPRPLFKRWLEEKGNVPRHDEGD